MTRTFMHVFVEDTGLTDKDADNNVSDLTFDELSEDRCDRHMTDGQRAHLNSWWDAPSTTCHCGARILRWGNNRLLVVHNKNKLVDQFAIDHFADGDLDMFSDHAEVWREPYDETSFGEPHDEGDYWGGDYL